VKDDETSPTSDAAEPTLTQDPERAREAEARADESEEEAQPEEASKDSFPTSDPPAW
jgi:hypothetical protein